MFGTSTLDPGAPDAALAAGPAAASSVPWTVWILMIPSADWVRVLPPPPPPPPLLLADADAAGNARAARGRGRGVVGGGVGWVFAGIGSFCCLGAVGNGALVVSSPTRNRNRFAQNGLRNVFFANGGIGDQLSTRKMR